MDHGYWVAALVGLALLAYAGFVNRRLQRYRGRAVFDAPAEAVWDLIDIRPEKPCWLPTVKSLTWVDAAAQDMDVALSNGNGLRQRVLLAERPMRHEAMASYRWAGSQAYGDLAHSRCVLTESDGRTTLDMELVFERRGLLNGFAARFGYPFQIGFFNMIARQELERRGVAQPMPWGTPAAAPVPMAKRVRQGLLRWPVLLAAATVASLAYEFGLVVGLSLLGMLLVHEYGHVWAMRRHGHQAPRIFLIPFFGGLAVGSRFARSDAEDSEIALMGPAFGIVPGLVALAAYQATGLGWLAGIAFFLVFINLFNLVPFPPLDGGQVTRTLLRPLGPKTASVISALLILAGAGASVLLKSPILMIVFVIGGIAWSAAPLPPEREPLRAKGLGLVAASYLGLIAAHVAALHFALALSDVDDLFALMQTAPTLF
jgi:Zn-dependent protease